MFDGTKANANMLIQRGVMEENDKQLELIKFFEKLTQQTILKEKRWWSK